jgi:hypothetical protein
MRFTAIFAAMLASAAIAAPVATPEPQILEPIFGTLGDVLHDGSEAVGGILGGLIGGVGQTLEGVLGIGSDIIDAAIGILPWTRLTGDQLAQVEEIKAAMTQIRERHQQQ